MAMTTDTFAVFLIVCALLIVVITLYRGPR
jgi:hypothetical protein